MKPCDDSRTHGGPPMPQPATSLIVVVEQALVRSAMRLVA